MAIAGVLDVLRKHFVLCYVNMKLSFMFICILSVNTKRKHTLLNWPASTIDCVI
jgi:hypothetical protein